MCESAGILKQLVLVATTIPYNLIFCDGLLHNVVYDYECRVGAEGLCRTLPL